MVGRHILHVLNDDDTKSLQHSAGWVVGMLVIRFPDEGIALFGKTRDYTSNAGGRRSPSPTSSDGKPYGGPISRRRGHLYVPLPADGEYRTRCCLRAIKDYLANAGVFVDGTP